MDASTTMVSRVSGTKPTSSSYRIFPSGTFRSSGGSFGAQSGRMMPTPMR